MERKDWRKGKTNNEIFKYMLNNEIGCDVILRAGRGLEYKVPVHRFILISKSPVFEDMFSAFEPGQLQFVDIPDLDTETIDELLEYMYGGEVDISEETAPTLICVAKKFRLQNLVDQILDFLLSVMKTRNVCSMLEIAHTYKEDRLKSECLTFIQNHAKSVLCSCDFRKLCRACVAEIIQSDYLRIPESLIYLEVTAWAEEECRRKKITVTDENKRHVLGNIVYLIRFPIMDKFFFADVVSNQDILTETEKNSVFRHFHGVPDRTPDRTTNHVFKSGGRFNYSLDLSRIRFRNVAELMEMTD